MRRRLNKQICHFNKEGVSGPFIGIDNTAPAPRSPQIPMGSSSYKMHFSPGKKREAPAKFFETSSVIHSNPNSGGLRHISNGDAFLRHNYLSRSIDYPRQSPRREEDFRIKKNLTTNADRILTKPSSVSNTPTLVSPEKFEELRKQAYDNLNSTTLTTRKHLNESKTYESLRGQENFNSNNALKNKIDKPLMKSPAGTYNTEQLKRYMGMPIDAMPNSSGSSNSMHLRSSMKVGQNVSLPSFNDPGYHRTKNYNNYGYDVLTGARKDSSNRLL